MNETNVVVINSQRDPINIGFFQVLAFAAFVGLVIAYFWQILVVAIVAGFGLMLWRSEMQHRRRELGLSSRADYQDRLYLEGDPRGIYGDGHEGPQR